MVSNEADSLEEREEMKVEKVIHLLQSVTSRKKLFGGTPGPSSHLDGTDRGQYHPGEGGGGVGQAPCIHGETTFHWYI